VKIAVLGAGGFVGGACVDVLKSRSEHEVISVYRATPMDSIKDGIDLVIHAANPAKRFLANQHPDDDLHSTVDRTKFFLQNFVGSRFLLISSISCRTQSVTPYGKHRRDCEDLVLWNGGGVVRLGPLFGGNREHDTLHDIVNGRDIYYSAETEYAYCELDWAAKYIVDKLLPFEGLIEIGARNTVTLQSIATLVSSRSRFTGPVDHQFPQGFDSGPDASEVFKYALGLRGGKQGFGFGI